MVLFSLLGTRKCEKPSSEDSKRRVVFLQGDESRDGILKFSFPFTGKQLLLSTGKCAQIEKEHYGHNGWEVYC